MIKCNFTKYTSKLVMSTDKLKYKKKVKLIEKELSNPNLLYLREINNLIELNELNDLISASNYVRENCDVFIVIGIGGSYMGSKAVIEALLPTFDRESPEIIYLGTDLSPDYYREVIDYIKDKEVIVNVISKSGNTLEPNIAFDIMKFVLEGKYSKEELLNRIIVTTDRRDGSLRRMVNEEGYFSLEIPKKIGGRFSVFTSVGLLPIAVSGIDIIKLLEGFLNGNSYRDDAIDYAITRQLLFNKKKSIESLTVYNPKLYYFTEWFKQLFAETQGKGKKGILPISNVNTRDLHSLGQFLQDGNPIIFETVIDIEEASLINVNKYNKTLNEINRLALSSVCAAHEKGGTPSLIITIDELGEYQLGELINFFMIASIAGAILIDVNPFNQPGVEAYKNLIDKALNNKYLF